MDIIQGNKVVAEYQGYEYVNDSPQEYPEGYMYKADEDEGYGHAEILTEMEYSTDWNWFMPAYNKFRSEVISPVLYEDLPKEVIEKWEKLEMSILTCDIRYAFEKLVELINWKNNKS
ncbi:MAG: hypothetical protein ACTHMM_18270 [Agriterribacter sp.]